ncbi:hypothetical protein SAY87_031370 [Trapa incisa]|nr:hypothetical protein SAY87_031370 [Trapa incisa]
MSHPVKRPAISASSSSGATATPSPCSQLYPPMKKAKSQSAVPCSCDSSKNGIYHHPHDFDPSSDNICEPN